MAGKPIGTIYAELDLDTTKYTKAQQTILAESKTTSLNVEKNWSIIGQKSDVMYDAMRQRIINAYEMIVNKAGTSASEIVRAEEAKNAKLKALNEQQFGHQTSLLDSLKKNWMAASAAIIAAWMLVNKAISIGKEIASTANDIQRMSNTIGISTIEWQKFSYAAKMSDVSNESLMRGMKALSQSMEEFNKKSGEGYQILTALGLSTVDVTGKQKPLTQMFKEVATEFSKYEGGARMVDYANKLMGKSGMDLIPMFKDGGRGIDEYGDKLVRMGSIIGEVAIKAGSAAENEFKDLDTRINSMKVNLAPLVLLFAKGIENLASMVNWITKPIEIPWWLGGGTFSFFTGLKAAQKEIKEFELAVSHGPEYISTKGTLPLLSDDAAAKKLIDEIEKQRVKLFQIQQLVKDFGWEDYTTGVEKITYGWTDQWKLIDTKLGPALQRVWGEVDKQIIPVADASDEAMRAINRMVIEEMKRINALEEQSKIEENLKKVEGERIQQLADDMFPTQDKINRMIEQANEYHEKGIELLKKEAKETEELAKKRIFITRQMTDDIGKFTKNEYDLKKDLLDEQYRDYSKFVKDKNILDRWYDIRLIQLEEERILRSNDFFAGMKVAMDRNVRDQMTWGRAGYEIFETFATSSKEALSTILFDSIKRGTFDSKVVWERFSDSMLKKFTDILAQMMMEAVTKKIVMYFTTTWTEGGSNVLGIINKVLGLGINLLGGGSSVVEVAPEVAPFSASAAVGFQHGGFISEPIFGVGKSGRIYTFGEAGPEFITPAGDLASKGRYGDTILAHINSTEAAFLKLMGGSGTINPYTGLPEFGFFKSFLKIALPILALVAGGAIGGGIVGEILGGWGAVTTGGIIGGTALLTTALAQVAVNTILGTLYDNPQMKISYKGANDQGLLSSLANIMGGIAPKSDQFAFESMGGGISEPGKPGYKYGGIARGPESGYWARLHGAEIIAPLKIGGGSRGDLAEMVAEVKQLREDLARVNFVIAKNTGKMAKILSRFDDDGLPAERILS